MSGFSGRRLRLMKYSNTAATKPTCIASILETHAVQASFDTQLETPKGPLTMCIFDIMATITAIFVITLEGELI